MERVFGDQERLRFVARLLVGERMSEICRDFGISRKTGYKIFNRYRDEGSMRAPIARAGRYGMPTSYQTRWGG